MIVASLLLILVAVALLVLGLSGGSSALLIGSIVASLVAAVFLVIGARRAASARREAETAADPAAYADDAHPASDDYPDEAFVAEPQYAAATAEDPARRSGVPADLPSRDEPLAGDSADFPPPAGRSPADWSHADRQTVQFDANDVSAAHPADADPVGGVSPGDLSADEAREAGRRDAEAAMGAAMHAPDDDMHAPDHDRHAPDYDRPDYDRSASDYDRPAPDYDRASSAINAARSENPGEDAWRREPSSSERPETPGGVSDDAGAGPGDEFAEPDVDDPDDEPLPQSVRPADAVRVARLDTEVLVVDGRPRYHLPDCPHLVGRLTEPIPVNEAVELGFSPCGLCRPVDRLVASAARR
jgi:hypothetical protein